MVPEVKKCDVKQCFYNTNNMCCAHSILVGSDQPICETFMESAGHTSKCGQSEVGACHVSQCQHNDSMFCHACDDIEVVLKGNQAWCNTFESR